MQQICFMTKWMKTKKTTHSRARHCIALEGQATKCRYRITRIDALVFPLWTWKFIEGSLSGCTPTEKPVLKPLIKSKHVLDTDVRGHYFLLMEPHVLKVRSGMCFRTTQIQLLIKYFSGKKSTRLKRNQKMWTGIWAFFKKKIVLLTWWHPFITSNANHQVLPPYVQSS